MRRVRLAFVLLVIGLAVPTGLLIQRALGGVQAQREAQNRAVAERIFDEMERTLSDFLRAEDERSASQYGFYVTPEGAPADVRVRSPLAALPSLPFVVGHFEIGSDGIVRTPLLPEDREAARLSGDFVLSLELEERARRVIDVAAQLDLGESRAAARFPPLTSAQAPATTRRVGRAGKDGASASAPEEAPASEAYDVLQQLNRGAQERADRAKKVMTESAPLAEPAAPEALEEEDAFLMPDAADAADAAEVAGGVTARFEAPGVARDQGVASAASGREERMLADARSRLDALPGARQRLASLTARVTVDPFLSRPGPDGLIILMRTVLENDRALRQGIVIDVDALLGYLRGTTLREGTLEGGAVELGLAGEVIGRERPRYRHRFGEPFDLLTVDLTLAPLGDVAGAGAVFLLSALSLGVMGIALFALYRMVAVTVSFAERRSNFVAAVSHELKTPLTAIRMYGEMLRDGLVPDESKRSEYYRSITAESERLSRLINNVLEFSRLERGSRGVEMRVGDVAPAVREAVELLAPHAEERGQRLELEIDADLPAVHYEHDALIQVLFNLIDNALKYASNVADPVIEISCRRVPSGSGGAGVEIAVRDHGPGVPTAHATRILEAFYRGENELTRRTQGTGIGLALVKGLAEEMGARLSVGNATGGGFRAVLRMRAS